MLLLLLLPELELKLLLLLHPKLIGLEQKAALAMTRCCCCWLLAAETP